MIDVKRCGWVRLLGTWLVLVGSFLANAADVASLNSQTVPGVLSIHTTIESAGIVASYTGDDNQNNAATVWYRPVGGSAWWAGPDTVADRRAREWRVSLVHLEPGTGYEIEVRFTDPDDVASTTVGGMARTRPDYPDVGSGGRVWYVPDDGELQTVIDMASPGDTIRLRAGIHYTTAELGIEDSGQPGHYLTLEADVGAQAVLDGTDRAINDPLQDNWLYYQDGIYYTDLAWGDTACSDFVTMPNYVGEYRDGDGVRYLVYNQGSGEWSDFLAAPPGKAFYDCDGAHRQRLYVSTYDGDDPDNHDILVSRYKMGLRLAGADYVRIRNIEFRYYGWYGIHLASPGADYNIVEGNTFHGSRYNVFVGDWLSRGGQNQVSANNLIQNNRFYERGYRDSRWTWRMQYDHARAVGVHVAYAKPGNVIRRNTFQSGQDAIVVSWQSHDTDVYGNEIQECMDDGIEVDNQPGYNIRVWANTIRYCYSNISNQDLFMGDYWNAGPIYIFRNVIVGGDDPLGRTSPDGSIDGYSSNYAFKVGTDLNEVGRIYYYHNTISISGSSAGGNGVQNAGGVYFSGLVSRNNIWSIRGRVFHLGPGATRSHDLDYDNLHNAGTPTDNRFIQWSNEGGPSGNGVYRNLADFQKYVGQELHGISNNGTLFESDWSLKRGSPEIDAGCIIVGFNDRGPWAYKKQAPDMGAFEYTDVPDFRPSVKLASRGAVSTGESTTYTLRIVNAGIAALATVTDVVPSALDYLTGTLTADTGTAWVTYQDTVPTVHWQGVVSEMAVVEIRYRARVVTNNTVAVQNTAWIDSELTEPVSRSATIIANGWSSYTPIILRDS